MSYAVLALLTRSELSLEHLYQIDSNIWWAAAAAAAAGAAAAVSHQQRVKS
jgi:hypothetical protein